MVLSVAMTFNQENKLKKVVVMHRQVQRCEKEQKKKIIFT